MSNIISKNIPNKVFAVIGGGPAGSLTALLLKRSGLKVILFEKSSFPLKRKICGEYLCPSGKNSFKSIGLENLIEQYPRIYGMKIVSPSGLIVDTLFPNDEYGYAVQRDKLDNDLLVLAQKEGVDVVFNTMIKSVESKDSNLIILTDEKKWEVDFIIGADGRSSMVSKWIEADVEFVNKRVALHAYLPLKVNADSNNQGQMHIFNDGSYCGLNPVGEKLWNFSIVCDAKILKKYSSIHDYINFIIKENKVLDTFVDASKLKNEEIKVISNLTHPVKKITDSNKRTILVGDASGFVDPLTGEGMYHAIQTAIDLCDAIVCGFKNDISLYNLYEEKVASKFSSKTKINYFFQLLIKLPMLCNIIAMILNSSYVLRSSFIGLIGNVITPSKIFSFIFKECFSKKDRPQCR